MDRLPLGPALGQCCGGAVVLLTEVWDARRLADAGDPVARPLPGHAPEPPLAVARLLAGARNGSGPAAPVLRDGWMIEPVTPPMTPLWLWGAGHVGRAIASVMAPLPDIDLTWIDIDRSRFPEVLPEGAQPLTAADPAELVRYAPRDAQHLVLTYSHALDLELCHRLLDHGFGFAGADRVGHANGPASATGCGNWAMPMPR